jgi:zinc protease
MMGLGEGDTPVSQIRSRRSCSPTAGEQRRSGALGARLRRSLYALALGAAVAQLACGHGASAPPPAPPDAGVKRMDLENGLRVVVVPNRLAPVAAVVVSYRVGSNEAPRGFPGTAHALEHMMFRGSPGLGADQLADIGAELGGEFNAETGGSATQYFFAVPAADLDVVLQLEALRMRGASIEDAAWGEERGAIEQEVARDLSDPEYVLQTRLLEALFHGTPYAHDALGTRASFDATSAGMLRDFHDSWYLPNNAVVIVTGDVDPTWVATRVKRRFGDLAAGNLPPRPVVELGPVAPQTLRLPSDRPTGLALVAFRTPGYAGEDYAATRILVDALDGARGALQALVDAGEVIDAGVDLDTFPEAGMGTAWVAFPADGDGERALQRLRTTLDGVRRDGIPPDLVAAAQLRARTDAERRRDSVLGLAMAWSQAVAVEGRDSPDDDLALLERVRPEDVNRAAARALDPEAAVSAILTPRPTGVPTPPRAAVGSVPASEAPPANRATHAVSLPDWAEAVLRRLDVPRSSLRPVVSRLSNGLELIVQPEDTSDVVGVYGRIRSQPDLQTPPGQEGVDRVLGELLDDGTQRLSRDAFRKAVDDVGAELVPGTDFSLEVLRSGFESGTALLADAELRPRLAQEDFEIARSQVADVVRGEQASPEWQSERALLRGLFPQRDPSLRRPTPESVSRLTRDQVVAYHHSVFRPDMTAIVVIGKLTPEEARKVIERHFGSWRAEGPKPDVDLPRVPTNPPGESRIANPARMQDEVTLAQSLDMDRSDPDYYPLELGDQVLGGGFYASRLYRVLRAERGLVYHVDVSLDAGRTRSVYAVHFGCDPGEVPRVRQLIAQALRDLQREPPTAEELRLAKALLLRQIPLAESSESAVAQGLLERATLDLPLDEPTVAARRYAALDGKAVRDAFARRVRPDGLVQVTEGPP